MPDTPITPAMPDPNTAAADDTELIPHNGADNVVQTHQQPRPGFAAHVLRLIPGILLCVAGTGIALGINRLIPAMSVMLAAIVLGAVLANTTGVFARGHEGVGFAAKHLLRAGIVLLGLQVVVSDVLALGVPMLLTVAAVVGIGVVATIAIGKAMGIEPRLVMLIACGFSICGAAAIAGAQTIIKGSKAQVAAGLALVVAFGTAMIPLIPALGAALGLSEEAIGAWAGASIHEVAQVVAAAGTLGDASSPAMKIAVITKLSRVILLAVVIIGLGAYLSRTNTDAGEAKPALMPGFVAGFIGMVVIASIDRYVGVLPEVAYSVAKFAQSVLLAMAMFALGCGVNLKELRTIGGKPIILAATSTLIVTLIGLAGALVTF
ncbi:YeiH family protein [Corynebacterium uterequi]|uniref:Putative membrane protein n=1 Tax=Corynebacterium uterequi TaxID=1072256 RepID=A0A0G3HGZ7_9CORY|nr:putative sulfate exporter family transporter [Corynebacterium uterequi]AKK10422.1 putative membrane protein [Corynebacterium uterequi]